jgi:hypothetical protein
LNLVEYFIDKGANNWHGEKLHADLRKYMDWVEFLIENILDVNKENKVDDI